MPSDRPLLSDVVTASDRIKGIARRTPLITSHTLSKATGATVKLKLESVQETGSFKVRGAANVILSAMERGDVAGVVTYSTGNHGRAVAHVANVLGIPAVVCLSSNTTPDKQEAIRRSGAELRIVGSTQDDAAVEAKALAAEGMVLVDPIDDPLTIAGQATIGLELVEDWPQVDTVVVPLSGGALIAGIALAVKSHSPHTSVIGVSMEHGAAMHDSIAAGHPIEVPEHESLADSLQGGIGLDNAHTYDMVRELVDHVVLLDEDQIAIGMVEALEREHLILEGAGATPIAAVLAADRTHFGRSIALVVTGSAVDIDTLLGLRQKHLAAMATQLEPRLR